MKYNYILLLSSLLCLSIYSNTDIIIFSYNRPLQLRALLESMYKYISGIESVNIICRADNNDYYKAYNHLKSLFPDTIFKFQGQSPRSDFKPLLLKTLSDCSQPYLLFAVDDIIVKDYINLQECSSALETTNAYALYLRLGKNITHSYPNVKQNQPSLHQETLQIYSWNISHADADWGYPNNVDMTLYRKKDIDFNMKHLNYTSPNTLESAWASKKNSQHTIKGLCFEASKIVNLPLNRVQNDYNNSHMNYKTSAEFLTLFNQGKKLILTHFTK